MARRNKDALKYSANIIGMSVVCYFAAYYAIRLIFSLVIVAFHKEATLQNPLAAPEWFMGLANLFISQGSIGTAILLLRSFCLKNFAPSVSIKHKINLSQLVFIPVFLGLGLFSNIFNSIANLIAQNFKGYTSPQSLILPQNSFAVFLYFIALCVAPAILEEIFVRGYIQGILSHWGPWFGIIVSSVLFTLLHPSLTAMPSTLIMSMMLGLCAYCTNSIVPGMILHFANNCVAFFFLYTQQNQDSVANEAFSVYLIIVIVMTAVICAGQIVKEKLYKQFAKIPRVHDPKNRQSRLERLIVSPCFSLVMLALFVKAISQLF